MDQADQELRETITHIWPLQAKKMLDLLVPRSDELNTGKLTVGKIYAGLLILESWRNTKFGQLETDAPVSKRFEELVNKYKVPLSTPKYYKYKYLFDFILLIFYDTLKADDSEYFFLLFF
jgi:hypothetical protein